MGAVEVALVAAVLVGAGLQRIAGMGFAMVVAPFAILLLPGQQGVVFANLCGAAAAVALIWPARAEIDRTRLLILAGTSIIGAAAGALIVSLLDIGTFRIVVGTILLAAIVVSLFIGRTRLVVPLTPASFVAGGATGMLVTMSGIGGPPMSIYAMVTRWDHRRFAATMQPFVALSSFIGAGAVLLSTPDSTPQLDPVIWLLIVAALVAGLIGGQILHRQVPAGVGRTIVIVLGIVGAITAIASGATIVAGDFV
ncbi:sulfite exporter TauE/SafE family protein [Microbacterium saperdae]